MVMAFILGTMLQAATPPLLIDRPAAQRPLVLVLGSPHLANNNRDVANVKIGDVLDPSRQREIETLVDSLARFRPTRIAVEWPASDQSGLDKRYAEYRDGRLVLSANERDQIALRLAARLGLTRVDAIDWNEMPPGEIADFDYDAWATAHGQAARLEALRKRSQAAADAASAQMRCTPIADWYRSANSAQVRREGHRRYFDFALFGDAEAAPGAVWFGNWYARNLRIFGNIARKAKSGDRLLVLYGSGHAYLLDQQLRESQAFAVIDPLAFLPAAQPIPNCR